VSFDLSLTRRDSSLARPVKLVGSGTAVYRLPGDELRLGERTGSKNCTTPASWREVSYNPADGRSLR
jgi:hypothetical protein